jgi:uncharacterized membrane protein YgaE (UPF0421/DUF939 family)
MSPPVAARVERWRVPTQTGLAAGISWWIATGVAGHTVPLSAPVVAVIAIGATNGGRARRTVDVIAGVTIGVAFATLLVSTFGRSAPLLALVVTAAMFTAQAARGGQVLTMQAGIAAILVVATQHDGSTDAALSRIADALIGGTTAATVSLFVLPPDPVPLLTGRLHALRVELADVLSHVADGLRRQDAHHLATGLERARATDELVAALHAARPVAAEVARFVPARRRARERVACLDGGAVPLDHAIRNARVIARSALALLLADPAIRDQCAAAITLLGEGVRRLDSATHEPSDGDDPADRAAERLAAIHTQSPSPALGAIAAAGRGIADDLAASDTRGQGGLRDRRSGHEARRREWPRFVG